MSVFLVGVAIFLVNKLLYEWLLIDRLKFLNQRDDAKRSWWRPSLMLASLGFGYWLALNHFTAQGVLVLATGAHALAAVALRYLWFSRLNRRG